MASKFVHLYMVSVHTMIMGILIIEHSKHSHYMQKQKSYTYELCAHHDGHSKLQFCCIIEQSNLIATRLELEKHFWSPCVQKQTSCIVCMMPT